MKLPIRGMDWKLVVMLSPELKIQVIAFLVLNHCGVIQSDESLYGVFFIVFIQLCYKTNIVKMLVC